MFHIGSSRRALGGLNGNFIKVSRKVQVRGLAFDHKMGAKVSLIDCGASASTSQKSVS